MPSNPSIEHPDELEPAGAVFVDRGGRRYAVVEGVDRMEPFLVRLSGDGDLWAFCGSNGPLTAGRVDPDTAFFPYVTADKLLRHADSSGPLTIFRVTRAGSPPVRWRPWVDPAGGDRRRRLLKSVDGTEVVFEETHRELGLRLTSTLATCDRYGLVRTVVLENLAQESARIEYLDGWHQLVPPNIGVDLWSQMSYLAIGYMRQELLPDAPIAVYALNAKIEDLPVANESLRYACAWSVGHAGPRILISDRQVAAFLAGEPVHTERQARGAMGAFLVADSVTLAPGAAARWMDGADTRVDAAHVVELAAELADPDRLVAAVERALETDRESLWRRVAAADGIQKTADETADAHHFANVLFNAMRGGTFVDGHRVPADDFRRYVRAQNAAVAARQRAWLASLEDGLEIDEVLARARAAGDVQLERLAAQYLPLTFGRRHGDPSRPWNRFSIRVKDETGAPVLGYEGNWRDIFQNWEALAVAYPGWLSSMISVFLNASTADGYNPYRITRDGIDWEVPDPKNPWASIGYWGDHQLIYLVKLLEARERLEPGRLAESLGGERFAYARVPYFIGSFDAALANPHDTITFDAGLHHELLAAKARTGADGCLRADEDGEPLLVSLGEKLLLPLLVKLTNFVPDGGVWLNTQRPEWNDANNALAGWGLSVITTSHAFRYLRFLQSATRGGGRFRLSKPVADLLAAVTSGFSSLPEASTPQTRFAAMRELGRAGEAHRASVYRAVSRPEIEVDVAAIERLAEAVLPVLAGTIRSNRRDDGLYHAYNLLRLEGDRAEIDRLYLMLEGQVGVIESGLLDGEETVRILAALQASDLYRPDQRSFVLYPDVELPSIVDRAVLPGPPPVAEPHLFTQDARGRWHFQADLRNGRDLEAHLTALSADEATRAATLELWERTFHHRSFTGRSRRFFMFEGLGSIYWHMISKLLLAVGEAIERTDTSSPARDELERAYRRVRDGLGFRRDARSWGAFPTDPYSHTPRDRGAQQPGMTGAVKEEILARVLELGVHAEGGEIRFDPNRIDATEYCPSSSKLSYVSRDGSVRSRSLAPGSIGFTLCGTPVVYTAGSEATVRVEDAQGHVDTYPGGRLPASHARQVLRRTGEIAAITVTVPRV